jgi:hypothetical protein
MAAKKNSLVANINRRKAAGKSRPKSKSTVSAESYDEMEAGWPKGGAKKKAKKKAAKKRARSLPVVGPIRLALAYRIGRGEEGVLTLEPWKSELLPLWKFATPALARRSAAALWKRFMQYGRANDFPGMDMARKFLQMGMTRATRGMRAAGSMQRTAEISPRSWTRRRPRPRRSFARRGIARAEIPRISG